jgi:hypothetical protein
MAFAMAIPSHRPKRIGAPASTAGRWANRTACHCAALKSGYLRTLADVRLARVTRTVIKTGSSATPPAPGGAWQRKNASSRSPFSPEVRPQAYLTLLERRARLACASIARLVAKPAQMVADPAGARACLRCRALRAFIASTWAGGARVAEAERQLSTRRSDPPPGTDARGSSLLANCRSSRPPGGRSGVRNT